MPARLNPAAVLPVSAHELSPRSRPMLSVIEGSTPAPPIPSEEVRALCEARQAVGRVDAAAWAAAVRRRDPVERIHRGLERKPVSRAFYKLCEMQPLLPTDVGDVLLLCEAPGGFYEAAGRLYPGARRVACSLEDEGSIPFDRRVSCVVGGLPARGDIRDPAVVDALVAQLGPHRFDLVTADGGVGHADLDLVEQHSLHLLLGQLSAALRLTREGGTCVLKLFEGSTRATRDVVGAARRLFRELHLYKPRTSKAANSERYVVAVGLIDTHRARGAAAELDVARRTAHPLALLQRPDAQIDRAFDALAAIQTRELHRLVAAARYEPHAADEVEASVARDVAWLAERVACLRPVVEAASRLPRRKH